MTRYSLFVLKVSLNTNKTNKQTNEIQNGDILANPGTPEKWPLKRREREIAVCSSVFLDLTLSSGHQETQPFCKISCSNILKAFPSETHRDLTILV